VHLKKVSKKIILITGGKGVLGSYFYNKYKTKYKIISFPYRLEQINKLQEWLKKKKFHYFVHFAAITSKRKKNYNKIHLVNKILPIKIIKLFQKSFKKEFRYFLFISTSHVYGFHKKKISEYDKRKPFNKYGLSKLGGECSVAMYSNSLILRITMTEKPFLHKKAYKNLKSNFMFHEDLVKILPKIINQKGILNVGGKSQSVFSFAKKGGFKVKGIKS